jgi:hypothetical protein
MARKSKTYSDINPFGFFGKTSQTRKTIKVFLVEEIKSVNGKKIKRTLEYKSSTSCT